MTFLLHFKSAEYLKGFLERGNRPQNGKKNAESGAWKHIAPPFTIRALTMAGAYAMPVIG